MAGLFTENDQSGSDEWDFGLPSVQFAEVSAKMPHAMIDIETMGTRPNSPIISVGAVAFDLVNLKLGERFYANICLESSIASGAVPDASTVMWWLGQSDDARNRVTKKPRLTVPEFLTRFSDWLDRSTVEMKSRQVWACGTDFDNVMLSEHYKRSGVDLPWMYWNNRDQRTVRELWREVADTVKRQGTHHNALDDATHQVEVLFAIRRHLAAKGKV